MKRIPCDVIRDLLPSYIDQLTSDASNMLIQGHVRECKECAAILDSMQKNDLTDELQDGMEKKEIDFLKKNRRRNRWIVLSCAVVIVVILAVVFITRYMVGEYRNDMAGDFFLWDVEADGNQVSLTGCVVDDIFKFTGMEFTVRDGVLYGEAKIVPSGFVASLIYGKTFHYEYTAPEPFDQVQINGRILWSQGKDISTMASRAYLHRHEFIGDTTQNRLLADNLGISGYLGEFSNELETGKRPYRWTLCLEQDIPNSQKSIRESDMQSYAYVLLATVYNLDEVSYVYTIDGKHTERTITAEDASVYFGQEIKTCYEDVSLLDSLIQKTGLGRYCTGSFGDGRIWDDVGEITPAIPNIILNIVNHTAEELAGVEAQIYIDGEAVEYQGGENADGSLLRQGQLLGFYIDPRDLDDCLDQNSLLEVEILIRSADNGTFTCPEKLRIPVRYGVLHDVHVTGNSQEGFRADP